ncbi:MAG: hypothetical protein ACYSW8_09580 [Planctomycetota bacterium]
MFNARTTLSVVLVTFSYLCNCVFGAENVVSNEPATAISITFLDIEAGKAAVMDKSFDAYFGRLQPMEMSAKTGSPITGETLDEQRKECRKRYRAQVREFADAEKQVLRDCIEKLDPVLREKFPRFAATPWSFLKVSNRVEGGLPHTQAGHIVLCERVCRQFASQYKTAPDRTVLSLAGLIQRFGGSSKLKRFQAIRGSKSTTWSIRTGRIVAGSFQSARARTRATYCRWWSLPRAKVSSGCRTTLE